ncbi:hypothetical protein KIW84_031830 [Lathyrus oleraceus]|uniref:Uncharacterized protein n=1 Tax=Pisum sativum TaxID=3888 RepID=A0A9D4XS99_PEA|nr:hypothetical protein KIW84_031830 [Pisum sativum]
MYFLCARSAQMAKKYVPLATQLHEGRKVCLNRLFLCGMYESLGCKTFTLIMTPFSSRKCRPEWFRKPFPNLSRQEEKEIHDTLLACFQPTAIWARSASSNSGLRAYPYNPNLAAMQFGVPSNPKALTASSQGISTTRISQGRKKVKTFSAVGPSMTKQLYDDANDSSSKEALVCTFWSPTLI